MLTIQIIAPGATQTFTIDVPADETIIFRPCAYCGIKLVRMPRKTCSDSCKSLKSRYQVGDDLHSC